MNPTDSDAMAPAVKQLTDAKIPVVAVDRAVNNAEVSSYIASDNVGGGKQAAKALSEAIHGRAKSWYCKARPAPQPPGNGARASTKV